MQLILLQNAISFSIDVTGHLCTSVVTVPPRGTVKCLILHCFQTSVSTFLATSLSMSKFQTTVTGGTNHILYRIMLILFVIDLLSELCQQLFQFYENYCYVSSCSIKRHQHIHSNFIYLISIDFFLNLAELIKTAFYILALLIKSNIRAICPEQY